MENTNQSNKIQKEFALSSKAIDNRITVFVLTIIIFLMGLISYISMPSEAFPEIITPEIYVGTPYPGNSPLDIEKLVTRPIEKEINAISGVDEINSTSVQGYSTIQVKFSFDVSPAEALQKVKDKVDIAKSNPNFPQDLPVEPNVFELNFAELVPILNINLSGDFSIDQLKEYAEYLEDKIEALPEISKVEIRGIDEKEVRVSIDQRQLELLNLSFDDIGNAIRQENVSISGGDFLIDGFRRNVRFVGEFKDIEEIGEIIVKNENAEVVYLKDIADITFGEKEKESYAREFGNPVVMLDVMKRGGENLIIVSEKIDKILEEAQAKVFPPSLSISKTNDQSDSTRNQLSELENSIIFGVLLVVLVLMFFLGLRNALFVGIAIPMSMLLSFAILSFLGVTLNTIVLFALVLALGLLVDNGIVVVENIYRLMDEGMSAYNASKQGVGEVAVPIIASTATTLAAFLPLAFWPGIFGEFMKYLPITLIIVLGSSLFVGLVINPALTSVYMKLEEKQPNKKRLQRFSLIFFGLGILALILKIFWLGNILIFIGLLPPFNLYILTPTTKRFQNQFLPRLENAYERFLNFALKGKNPLAFFFGTFALLFVSFGLISNFPPKVIFFPENQPNLVNIFIELPIGTDIQTTNKVAKDIESEVIDYIKKFVVTENFDGNDSTYNFMVSSVIGQVGMGAGDPNQGPQSAPTPNKAKVTIAFREFKYRRGIQSSDVLEEIRGAIRDYPGASIFVEKNREGPPAGAPINLEVSGEDYEKILATAEELRFYLNKANVPGVEELKLDVEIGKPELPIDIDRRKARTLGISTYQIGDAVRTALFGKEVSTYKSGNDDYPINLRYKDEYRYNLSNLLDTRITFRDQASGKIKQIPISAVATPQKSSTFSSVKRSDLTRVITISSNVLEGFNPTETNNKIKEILANYEMPEGVNLAFTGEQEKQAQELAFLSKALMIAIFMIFLIMVSQFNSASMPFIIMISVILSLIGVFLGLVIFRMDFVIMMTMIGIISLAGVVVNNAIVLIDYTNLTVSRKKEELGLQEFERLDVQDFLACIVDAGKKRLRPVLLTAITTILGLLPLATGMNINFYTLFSEYDPQIYFGGDNVIFWGPMSWTVIFGLTFATFLTLVIVPVMYYLLQLIHYRRMARLAGRE